MKPVWAILNYNVPQKPNLVKNHTIQKYKQDYKVDLHLKEFLYLHGNKD